MDKEYRYSKKVILFFSSLIVIGLIFTIIFKSPAKTENIKAMMSDAVLHQVHKVAFFGLEVNPALVGSFIVVLLLLTLALCLRVFSIPRFKQVPTNLQLVIESVISYYITMAKEDSHEHYKPNAFYITVAAIYIFFGTLFELLGWPAITTHGSSLALPAPLADMNAAIAMGGTTYLFILISGLRVNGLRGLGLGLKEFSLPLSMSFRLFGSLLSGLLVTELVYFALLTSFVLPVLVAVLFTLIHAIVQAYVLTMLTSHYYGEVTEMKKEEVEGNPQIKGEIN